MYGAVVFQPEKDGCRRSGGRDRWMAERLTGKKMPLNQRGKIQGQKVFTG
jgi:hypothetical protein